MNPNDIITAIQVPSRPHRRVLNIEEQRLLARLLSTAFNADISEKIVEKTMNYVSYVEKRMVGRMASHVEDLIIHYLMRYFASQLAEAPDAVNLEIGTLFGGTVLLAHHASRLSGKNIPIHVIDPFEGYYGPGKDIITAEAIDKENFLKNLDSLDIPRDEVVIHQGFSTDPAIIAECQPLRLLSLLIDGDHSYDGIKNDWLSFAHLVVPGGYVLIDNYNDQHWPDVMRYVNSELLPGMHGRWEVALVYATSLLLRRTAAAEPDDRTDAQRLFGELQSQKKKMENEIRQLADDEAEQEQELAILRDRLAEAEVDAARKADQIQGLTAELQELHEVYLKSLADLDAANSQMMEQRELFQQQAAANQAEISARDAIIGDRENTIAGLQSTIADIHNSLSWKVTAPLRAIAKPLLEAVKK